MCVTEIFVDIYPDGGDIEFRQTRLCQYGRPGRPCDTHSILENTPRRIDYGEPTSEFIIRQLNTPPRSSTSSGRPSFVEIRGESPKPRRKRRSGDLLLSAFFGDPIHRRRNRRENVVVIDGPPSPRSPRSPRTPRTPLEHPSHFTSHWAIPNIPRTPPPLVYDAEPRGREPVIVDDRNRSQRASSIEVHIDRQSPSRQERSRSPSPTLSELHRRDEEEEQERRRRRDEREARLAAELEAELGRRRREERRALHDAEINARPAVPNPPLRKQPNFRPVVEQSDRLNDLLGDMNLSARGERVIAEAVADRKRREERELESERMIRAGLKAEDAEAQRQRLRRRFTIGRPPSRRHRILYDDGTHRYE